MLTATGTDVNRPHQGLAEIAQTLALGQYVQYVHVQYLTVSDTYLTVSDQNQWENTRHGRLLTLSLMKIDPRGAMINS